MVTTPPAARRLHTALVAHGWHTAATPGTGTVAATQLGYSRGDGTRPREIVDRPCSSYAVRARHPDRRALAAVWCSTSSTAKGVPSWKLDQAWTWTVCDDQACRNAALDHPAALPRPVASAELVAAASAGAELEEVAA